MGAGRCDVSRGWRCVGSFRLFSRSPGPERHGSGGEQLLAESPPSGIFKTQDWEARAISIRLAACEASPRPIISILISTGRKGLARCGNRRGNVHVSAAMHGDSAGLISGAAAYDRLFRILHTLRIFLTAAPVNSQVPIRDSSVWYYDGFSKLTGEKPWPRLC